MPQIESLHRNVISSLTLRAIVGEKKWEQGIALFCKPFMKAKVRYFESSQAADAQAWIEEPSA